MSSQVNNTPEEVTVADVLAAVQHDPKDAEIDRLCRQLTHERRKHAIAADKLAHTKRRHSEALALIEQLRDDAQAAAASRRNRRELEALEEKYETLLDGTCIMSERLAQHRTELTRPHRN